jgi:hypothetical protein
VARRGRTRPRHGHLRADPTSLYAEFSDRAGHAVLHTTPVDPNLVPPGGQAGSDAPLERSASALPRGDGAEAGQDDHDQGNDDGELHSRKLGAGRPGL